MEQALGFMPIPLRVMRSILFGISEVLIENENERYDDLMVFPGY